MFRVAYLCEFPSLNGGENSLLSFLASAQSEVHPLFLCPATGPLADRLDCLGYARHDFSLLTPERQRKPAEQINAELLGTLAELDVDLVHANSLSMSRILGRVAVQLTVPTLGHIRDILNVSGKVIADLSELNSCLAVSHATRQCYLDQGMPDSRVTTVYNGIDRGGFQAETPHESGSLRASLGIASSVFLIGGVGQIGLRKAWDVLLDAVEILLERCRSVRDTVPDIQIVIAGLRHSEKPESIEYEQSLIRRSYAGPLAERVHFIGYHRPISQLLHEIDVLAHPAHQEPLGRVLLEAAACAVPVVATAVGGTAEIFGESGAILVPSKNAEAMALGLEKVFADDGPLVRGMTEQAGERLTRLFGRAAHRERMLALYQDVLASC